ncbi:MAG: HAD-IA family hydrolase [Clostridia bacterium]|nr:HAD-IA family hydrolase [Clostridia bacterium]
MLEAVFFDLDGTLLDAVPDIRAALNGALADFGYPAVSYEETVAYVGNGARKLIERAAPEGANIDRILESFAERYAKSDNALTKVYPGIYELLSDLKARGVKLAVVTNKLQASTEKVIEKFFPNTFDFVGGDSGAFPCKPDPSLTFYAALTMRVARKNCLFIGDGETDVLTAKNAGMVGVSVLWGYRSRKVLEEAGARTFISQPGELERFLR